MGIASFLLALCDIFLFLSVIDFVDSSKTRLPTNFNENIFLKKLREKRDAANTISVKNYLTKYGYVHPLSMHAHSNQAGQTSWKDGLRDLQEFFGLKKTGKINQEILDLIKKPRCANSDKIPGFGVELKRKKRFVRVGSKWHTSVVTYAINNFTPKLGKQKTHEAIDAAFAAWSKHIPLEFRKVSHQNNPDIITFFAEGYHNDNTAFDGVGGYLAHAYYPGTGIGGDTHFDGAEPWTLHQKAYEGNDLFLVAVHELGHALGLGHSMNQDAIMAPVYRHHDTNNFQLPQDDISGIQNIYGRRNSKPIPPLIPTTTLPHSVTPKYYPPRPRRPPVGRPKKPPIPPTSTTQSAPTDPPTPDICKLTRFDAVSFLRRELYVFSGPYMWRRQSHDRSMQGPYKITQFWAQLNEGVDAAYEDLGTNTIVFFKEHLYWEYDGIKLRKGFPRPVRFLGLQNEHVNAAVWWKNSGKTYFFQDYIYWRYSNSKIERNYPKPMSMWKGVPVGVDAAFAGVDEDGRNHTYFVKGTNYWKFNNKLISVVDGPKSFKKDWLRCDFDVYQPETIDGPNVRTMIAVALSCSGAIFLLLAVTLIIRYRNARVRQLKTKVVSGKVPPLAPNSQFPSADKHYLRGEKTVCITAAQKKLRLLRFSIQGQV